MIEPSQLSSFSNPYSDYDLQWERIYDLIGTGYKFTEAELEFIESSHSFDSNGKTLSELYEAQEAG